MKAEEQQVEDNDLKRGLTALAERAKSGRLINPKILAAVIAIVAAGGLWWYFSNDSKKKDSRRWTEFAEANSVETYKKVAEENPKTKVALDAKFNAARLRLTNDGLLFLNNPAKRPAALESTEKARDELKELATEFQKNGDRVLRAQALVTAADAELALVGVPKAGLTKMDQLNATNVRGDINAATELLTEAAKSIGEKSPAGETILKRVKDLKDAQARKDIDINVRPDALGKYVHFELVKMAEDATKKEEPKGTEKKLEPEPKTAPPAVTPTAPTTPIPAPTPQPTAPAPTPAPTPTPTPPAPTPTPAPTPPATTTQPAPTPTPAPTPPATTTQPAPTPPATTPSTKK